MQERIRRLATVLSMVAAPQLLGAQNPPPVSPGASCTTAVIWKESALMRVPHLDSAGLKVAGTSERITISIARMSTVMLAAEMFCLSNHDEYPTTTTALLSYAESLPARSACRIDRTDFLDGWGVPLYYGVIKGGLILVSAGKDGQFATSDDISLPAHADTIGATTLDVRSVCADGN